MRPTEMFQLAESLFIAAGITAVPCFAVLRWIVLLAARPLGPLTIEHVSDPLRAKRLRARQWECSNVFQCAIRAATRHQDFAFWSSFSDQKFIEEVREPVFGRLVTIARFIR
ncbi:hypothetical protein C8Q76DRAFT_734964 [Earliella scabrosa]|nr:hypothetical protein C8Q76DRAFT_734964 [Earliella scabrosa]